VRPCEAEDLEKLRLTSAVGRCTSPQIDPKFDCAWIQRLKVKIDEALSKFAFNFKLRPHRWETQRELVRVLVELEKEHEVRRCRLTPG